MTPKVSDMVSGKRAVSRIEFGTKAETLARLLPFVRKSVIEDLVMFNVSEWEATGEVCLRRIATRLGTGTLVVRSSAIGEDGVAASRAGAYTSVLGVNGGDAGALREAVDAVVHSYDGRVHHQVFVQRQVSDVFMSGVITTQDLDTGAPYYVINYDDESGKTDTITGGTGVNKTVLVYRNGGKQHLKSPRIRAVIAAAEEVEHLTGRTELDIEFVLNHQGIVYVLQVRPLATAARWDQDRTPEQIGERLSVIEDQLLALLKPRPGVLGRRTIFSEMSDWNPVEIIGPAPRPLAVSLFRDLVTDRIWASARAVMGYRDLRGEPLMVLFGGCGFIDVRNSFNSFLPGDLDPGIGERLVDAWLDRLEAHPELHDKVEFDVAQTTMDFEFERQCVLRSAARLSREDREVFRGSLVRLTNRALTGEGSGAMSAAMGRIRELEYSQAVRSAAANQIKVPDLPVERLMSLLDECRVLGTEPFSIIARHAFIAEAFLRSLVSRGCLDPEEVLALKQSLVSVASHLIADSEAVHVGELSVEDFLRRYGHLRPGTYDILSRRYDQRIQLFRDLLGGRQIRTHQVPSFTLSPSQRRSIGQLIAEHDLAFSCEQLLEYIRVAIPAREHAKFVFSRNISDILEVLASWGAQVGLSREELSFIPIHDLLALWRRHDVPRRGIPERLRDTSKKLQEAHRVTRTLKLSHLICQTSDVWAIPLQRSAPNFISDRSIDARLIVLRGDEHMVPDLEGRIVCIVNADPGFDWIFLRGIAGLVTKYGGANSHMAIRCAELGLPAAIGCGEQLFQRLMKAGSAELNCSEKILRPGHA